ncbi:MAG: D-aminoacyl-tRNA deacylase [Gemmatimonadetes bacterium]|nr:D-aminoacyl-tRNA deacylase [Gemmatimonadota bacterium]
MKTVLQRVSRASVTVDGNTVGTIGAGLVVLVGFTPGDDQGRIDWMADKIVGLRVFRDDDGKMNRSIADVGGSVLVVSQFTLYGNVSKGRRPSFVDAAAPDEAIPLYEAFVAALRERGVAVETGEFGAVMEVDLVNDGPVTLVIER